MIRASRVVANCRIRQFSAKSLPKVTDDMVHVNYVSYNGDKISVAGLVGENIVEIARNAGHYELLPDSGSILPAKSSKKHTENWTQDLYGEDISTNRSHVVLAKGWLGKLPPPDLREQELLENLEDEVKDETSRLGSKIYMTKELDGLTVYIPEPLPLDIE
eukprot:maker-scaffold_13-snap-gene-6.66-mRNA-1 protein AED:0.01 eAED:0.01 QI:60/1/1/1/1/1/2/32/160